MDISPKQKITEAHAFKGLHACQDWNSMMIFLKKECGLKLSKVVEVIKIYSSHSKISSIFWM